MSTTLARGMPLSPSAGRMRLPRPPRRWTVLPSMASRSRSTRLVPVVMEVAAAADVAVEDMAEAVVVEDMEVEAMAAAVAVVDMEAAAVDMVAAVEVVDMEVADMVEMVVATEEAVEVVAVATAVAAVAMVVVVATEVDAVEEDTEAVATRPPWTKTTFKRSIFDLRFPFMHISYYSAMQYCQPKSVFFCI